MVQTSIPIKPRDVQIADIEINTKVLRSRTWEQLKFEIEYSKEKGTTSNSYLIQGDKIAIIDPPGQSFTEIYLDTLGQNLDWQQLDYIILQHVNPNRLATLKQLVEKAPQAKIICSKPALNALKNTLGTDQIQVVKDQEILDLGQGHQLQFLSVPTPRWVDGICTYDPQTQILYTDKFFGAHFCGEAIFDKNWKQLDLDRRFYFDCLHATQTKQLESAIAKFIPFPSKIYAPAHGPLIKYSLSRFRYDYQQWCQEQSQQELKVALLYASAYGNTAIMASAIADGLIQSQVAVESINCEFASPEEITKAIQTCDGFIIGSPTLGGHPPTQIQTALGIILANATKTKLAGVFGSYGWSGEAIDILENKLRDAHYNFGFEPIRVRFTPTHETLEQGKQAGKTFTQTLKKTKKLRTPRQGITETKIDRTEQAVGRIVGSLCVLTTYHNHQHSAVLISWVSQATFNPPGIMLAISQQQSKQLIAEPGDQFVLNILKEGRTIRKHFSEQISHSFDAVTTQPASNGCLIIEEGLAYLECTVQNRLGFDDTFAQDSSDHILLYANVDRGELLENQGITAIQYRKSGSHY
ncbi:MAG: diflavin flavoprotein [Halothece sp.]